MKDALADIAVGSFLLGVAACAWALRRILRTSNRLG